MTVVRVGDTLKALGALALAHRRRWAANVEGRPRVLVAVAGSVGKTTTRRAIATVLAGIGRAVHASAGNLNNAVGIPVVLLGLEPEHDAAVVEIGTSSPGEVAYGASLAEPDVAVLTRIAVEHSEGLGGLDEIAREEGAIFAALGPSGIAIANADDALCAEQLALASPRRRVAYGRAADAEVRLGVREARGLVGSLLRVSLPGPSGDPPREHAFHTPLLGEPGAYATCAALSVAHALAPGAVEGVSLERALAPLSREREPGRLWPHLLGDGTVVLDDSYNANTASVASGLEAARELATSMGRRLVVVLGEMRELGPLAASEHDEVAALAVATAPAALVAVAGEARRFHERAASAGLDSAFADDANAAWPSLDRFARPGDIVFVKGSRGVGLDALVERLHAARKGPPPP